MIYSMKKESVSNIRKKMKTTKTLFTKVIKMTFETNHLFPQHFLICMCVFVCVCTLECSAHQVQENNMRSMKLQLQAE